MGPSQGPGPEGARSREGSPTYFQVEVPSAPSRCRPVRRVKSDASLFVPERREGMPAHPLHTPNLGGMISQSSAPCAPGCRAKKVLCWFWLGVGATKLPMMQESLKDWSRAAQAWAERAELMEMGKWTCRPKVRAATGAQFIQAAPSLHSRPAIASSLLESGILQGTGSSETQKQLQSIQPALPF